MISQNDVRLCATIFLSDSEYYEYKAIIELAVKIDQGLGFILTNHKYGFLINFALVFFFNNLLNRITFINLV